MRRVAWLLLSLSLAGGGTPGLAAQDLPSGGQLADRGPRFLVPSGSGSAPAPVDARTVPVLRRRISVDLASVTLEEALTTISREAGLRLMYSKAVVPLESRVRLQANGITVAGALSEVLFDAGVDVLLTANGQAVLMKRKGAEVAVRVGTVTGWVADAKTGEVLVGADVSLEGTQWRTSTGADGRFRLGDVEAGSYTLAVRRIGYARQTRAVTVIDGQELTVDVALEPRPTQLDEVVTTVTGEQRLRELGHVVGRINADSLVKEAPVSSLSELLNGRVPGLQVFQAQGTVGGQVNLRIRGSNSLFLANEPIVIVDGVRYTTTVKNPGFLGPGLVEPTSPLNDLNPNDIESIEVVKGPSAATLYGTDAANGVLVVTTKRGQPGPARWNAYARSDVREISQTHFPDTWWGWRSSGGVPSLTSSCTLEQAAALTCTQDSVTALPNPLNDPHYTLFGSKPRWEFGANVAGGRQDLRYYFSGDYEDATGVAQMPPAIAQELMQQRGLDELPEEWREPNTLHKLNLRGNVSAALGETADLRVNTGYVRSAIRSLANSSYNRAAFMRTPATPYGNLFGSSPAERFVQTSTEHTDRFFGNVSGQWRPAAWLAMRATAGLDLGNRDRYSLARRSDAPSDFAAATGAIQDDRGRQVVTTAELGATATFRSGRLSARTAVGAQYVRTLNDILTSMGTNLPPGGTSVGEAASVRSVQSYAETVTLGSYLEETVGLNERLFLTGALRVDGGSAFGQDYDATVYPKVSASWLVSEEPFVPRVPGLDELRLRYAYGASGQQPTSVMARPRFLAEQSVENGVGTVVTRLFGLGNPLLRPERVREHEFGFDAAALGARLQLGLTWYHRRTADQIHFLELPPGLGGIYTNLGLTTQRGFEAELTARVLDTRSVSWDLTLQHALHRTKLVDVGGGTMTRAVGGGYVEGYPLGARFQRPVLGYSDVNGDGVIQSLEVQVGDTAVYMGESTPPISQTLTTVVGLFERRLRLSALLERRTGFTQINQLAYNQCQFNVCRGLVDPTTPLAEQAAARQVPGPMPEPADFTRLREVTAAVDLPLGLVRALRLRSASVAVSARNLALWTDFSGPDPESATVNGVAGGSADGIPQGRSWMLRLDLGF